MRLVLRSFLLKGFENVTCRTDDIDLPSDSTHITACGRPTNFEIATTSLSHGFSPNIYITLEKNLFVCSLQKPLHYTVFSQCFVVQKQKHYRS